MKDNGIGLIGWLVLIFGIATLWLGIQGYSPRGTTENEQPMCSEYFCK